MFSVSGRLVDRSSLSLFQVNHQPFAFGGAPQAAAPAQGMFNFTAGSNEVCIVWDGENLCALCYTQLRRRRGITWTWLFSTHLFVGVILIQECGVPLKHGLVCDYLSCEFRYVSGRPGDGGDEINSEDRSVKVQSFANL